MKIDPHDRCHWVFTRWSSKITVFHRLRGWQVVRILNEDVATIGRTPLVPCYRGRVFSPMLALTWIAWLLLGVQPCAHGQSPTPPAPSAPAESSPARSLLTRVIEQIALGPAFDAKIRQRVWVGGRDVIGVGTYEQAGNGSGWFNLQVAMHDGDGKHTLQQISDGRLAWTREQIGEQITLQRIDVGRLDQWMHNPAEKLRTSPVHRENQLPRETLASHLPPSVRVGAWTEMLESIAADHDLKVVSGWLEKRSVWIVRGTLRESVRAARLAEFGTSTWPELCPTQVVIAIAKTPSAETQFGQGLPLRIEFYTDAVDSPAASPDTESEPSESEQVADAAAEPITKHHTGRLISLIELYSIRPISAPPIGRFRFENQDMEVNFTNNTDRYLLRYGIHITERQSRMLRR